VRCRFWERRGRRGGGSDARSSFQRKKNVGLADRAGSPISEVEAAEQAGPDGKGVRCATTGPERKGCGPRLGQNHCSG
jgi:hypothetical protein